MSEDFDVAAADIFALGVLLHLMITGYLPFTSSPMDQNNSFPYQLVLDHARTLLTPNCLDLLSRMLALEPSSRPSIHQVLNHRWLKKYAKSSL